MGSPEREGCYVHSSYRSRQDYGDFYLQRVIYGGLCVVYFSTHCANGESGCLNYGPEVIRS